MAANKTVLIVSSIITIAGAGLTVKGLMQSGKEVPGSRKPNFYLIPGSITIGIGLMGLLLAFDKLPLPQA